MRTRTHHVLIHPQWLNKAPLPLPELLHSGVLEIKHPYPMHRLLTYDMHFHLREQPKNFCPFTAGMLTCLTMSTTLGLKLICLLLRKMNTFASKERWTPASTIWNAISQVVPTSTVFSKPYMWPTHRNLLALRTQFNQLQINLYHLSHFPQCLDKKYLPVLLYNYNNLLHWLHMMPISRLRPLLHTVKDLLLLPQEARHHLNVNTDPAPYVVEWVISRHSASITTATTARLCPLDTL
jgi:hypothetical protein